MFTSVCWKFALRRSGAVVAGFSLLFVQGCAVLQIENQVRSIDREATLGVKIANLPGEGIPVYALALDREEIIGVQEAESSGVAIMILPLSGKTAAILAFADLNRNRVFDSGEPVAFVEKMALVPLSDSTQYTKLAPLHLAENASLAADKVGLRVPTSGPAAAAGLHVAVGEVASLSEARFAQSLGDAGLWQPDSTLRRGDLGIYFVEPFRSDRIPVLFVHGIGGSPRDFSKLIGELDRSRYQAWFFDYPSGFRLGKAANAMNAILDILLRKYGVSRIHLVAHSMGGLVSRAAILRLQSDFGLQPVDKFVALSTPWGGDDAASGVRGMKYPIPAWVDMNPGSAFLKTLWAKALPSPTQFHIIYGYDSKRLPWLSPDNDGIINEKSAADPRAQKAAVSLFTAPYDHMGVLSAPETIEQVWSCLDGSRRSP